VFNTPFCLTHHLLISFLTLHLSIYIDYYQAFYTNPKREIKYHTSLKQSKFYFVLTVCIKRLMVIDIDPNM